jgi:phosphomethylpyrimidine synthase
MKISQEVRDYAQRGMVEKSTEFREQGGEIYKVLEGQTAPVDP